jgi:hypothetical protein
MVTDELVCGLITEHSPPGRFTGIVRTPGRGKQWSAWRNGRIYLYTATRLEALTELDKASIIRRSQEDQGKP